MKVIAGRVPSEKWYLSPASGSPKGQSKGATCHTYLHVTFAAKRPPCAAQRRKIFSAVLFMRRECAEMAINSAYMRENFCCAAFFYLISTA